MEYCHINHIIHRDIKPKNLVFDSKGYLNLTDFDIAKTQQPNNYRETSGTPGYMSPEVYFAIDVMGYEFMKGVRPYYGKSRKEIKDKIIAKQVSKGVRILLIVLINYYKESLLIDYVFMKQEKSKNIIGLKIFRGKIYIILN